jgi:hypothetical protein
MTEAAAGSHQQTNMICQLERSRREDKTVDHRFRS